MKALRTAYYDARGLHVVLLRTEGCTWREIRERMGFTNKGRSSLGSTQNLFKRHAPRGMPQHPRDMAEHWIHITRWRCGLDPEAANG